MNVLMALALIAFIAPVRLQGCTVDYTGCAGPVRTDPVPPPRPEETPPAIAEFMVEPTSILRSQSATLRWEVTGEVSSVSINQEIGAIEKTVPEESPPTRSPIY
jgi:hypothetical protein